MKLLKVSESKTDVTGTCLTTRSLRVTGKLPMINSSVLALSLMFVMTSYMGIAQAVVIPISSLLEVEGSAFIDSNDKTIEKVTQGASIDTLIAEASAAVANASATTNASATWVSSAQGTVNFSEVSLNFGPVNVATGALNKGLFSYDFQADINGFMTIDYSVLSTATGGNADFYLRSELFSILFQDTENGNQQALSLGQNSSGQFSASVVAGSIYHLEIKRSILGVSTDKENPTVLIDANQSANFNWQVPSAVPVSAVPVPTAVWLFGSGLIGLASVSKRNNFKK